MFVKIKELPIEVKKKAIKRMSQQRDFSDEEYLLGVAFDWERTKEGADYWSEVCFKYSDNRIIDELVNSLVADGIEVFEEEEVKPDAIVESVVNQLRERSEFGIKKYGTTLERQDLNTLDWIEHAKQEAMDFVLYLERLKREINA